MGFSYNKRKNIIELAVLRECTATIDSNISVLNANPDSDNRDGDIGWPGVMTIRVYELDGMSDHPDLPMAGDAWQLLEIACHSKLAARRYQKPKKGSKPDGSDDNGDMPNADVRSSVDSPLLWIRADPEMEYLAEIHLNQPVQMWINQLEKDEDVVAQSQAIAALKSLPELSIAVVNSLNNFLNDSKENDLAGLNHLIKFYKKQRFDADIGLPKPNDFRDFPEYFVLEAVPRAIAMVRATDRKSPREAVEFILQLLKYNDNNGNPYSDVFWLAALVQSVGELEFGQQSIFLLSSLLKRIDRLLQFDRLMPSYNGILTISCIRTLAQIALKLSGFIHLDHVFDLIKPFREFKTIWQVRIEASRSLLDLEFHYNGIDAALLLFIKYVEEEPSLRGQLKLAVHAMRLCQIPGASGYNDDIKAITLLGLLQLLESRTAFNNVFLRHYLFCILQVLARRSPNVLAPVIFFRAPTLYGVPKEKLVPMGGFEICNEHKNNFAALIAEIKPPEPPMEDANILHDYVTIAEAPKEVENTNFLHGNIAIPEAPKEVDNAILLNDNLAIPEAPKEVDTVSNSLEKKTTVSNSHEKNTTISNSHEKNTTISNSHEKNTAVSNSYERKTTISNSHERKVVKIRVKKSATTSKAEEGDNVTIERSQGRHIDADRAATSSVSVDAPQRNSAEAVSISNQNIEEVNSFHDHGSRITASIGSAKIASEGDNFGKELQCTADSGNISVHPQPDEPSSPSIIQDNYMEAEAQKYVSLQSLSVSRPDGGSLAPMDSPNHGKEKKKKDKKDKEKKKKDKEKKRKREDHKGHRDDPEYLEKKRLKKERKQKEKEMAKLLSEAKTPSAELRGKQVEKKSLILPLKKPESDMKSATVKLKPSEPPKVEITKVETKTEPTKEGTSAPPKFRIKIKNKPLNKS
ncbi:hypothetical protein COLO4_22716 [Corchorus olitorius]|uniref:Transcription initiation factor TFIID subunit 2 n=1 Tax=Corchorus olitorius TaxID=93759 RepID=A0A1R3IKF3_9ROSI|nr:hypothetical protein COLO4_22716 [Corchorus olitorius]